MLNFVNLYYPLPFKSDMNNIAYEYRIKKDLNYNCVICVEIGVMMYIQRLYTTHINTNILIYIYVYIYVYICSLFMCCLDSTHKIIKNFLTIKKYHLK